MENFLELNNEQMLEIDGGLFISLGFAAACSFALGVIAGSTYGHFKK